MKFSVIIPAYNRALQLMLTLTGFETQAYPMDQFEVIVVNDGSTDDTLTRLGQYQPPYRLQTVSITENTGRSAARNRGIAEAKGEYIIFCDPDFLVTPDFVSVHASYHQKHKNAVVSGVPHLFRIAYPHFYPTFSEEEKHAAVQVLQASGFWRDDYGYALEPVEIVTREDVLHQTGKLAQVAPPWEMTKQHFKEFSTTDVAPWLMSITRNLSLPKRSLQAAGGFNESFRKHGLEDWELGYRLHRQGCKFMTIEEIIGFHQEHPAGHRYEDPEKENLRLMYKEHGFSDPEISMFAVLSPSEGVEDYKNTLRILKVLRKSRHKSFRQTAGLLRRALTRGARLFYAQPDSPEYGHLKASLKQAAVTANQLYAQPDFPNKFRSIKDLLYQTCRQLLPPAPRKPARRRASGSSRLRARRLGDNGSKVRRTRTRKPRAYRTVPGKFTSPGRKTRRRRSRG
ncbi:glycosyltransferase [Paenibacillus macerans]|uniref:glycosyltransferase n=1 Tax=Paenibacillus macerans TaxID=44252 RepID=UPI00203AC6F3|nr:glycosyltransferase [Paenibacillus macerans]MCM3703767.1 glycosyltransferase [Paenibacillus macerans]